MNHIQPKYANFGQRLTAWLIDQIVFSIALIPIFMLLFETKTYTEVEAQNIIKTQGLLELLPLNQILIKTLIVLSITVFFWMRFAATPGKHWLKLKIVDADTGKNLSLSQSIVRYLGYFISAMPLFLGFIWILFDDKNQGWHDKFANSIVVTANDVAQQSDSTDKALKRNNDNDNFTA
ncbi:MAG: RDD family protein [Ostreibacterium sp.]